MQKGRYYCCSGLNIEYARHFYGIVCLNWIIILSLSFVTTNRLSAVEERFEQLCKRDDKDVMKMKRLAKKFASDQQSIKVREPPSCMNQV